MQNPLKSLPSVNELLESPPLRQMVDRANRSAVVSNVRSFLDNLRSEVQHAAAEVHVPSAAELAQRIAEWILRDGGAPLRPVINATGVLLDPRFGSAPLAKEAVEAMRHVSTAYASIGCDAVTGEAACPSRAAEKLLCELSGAEAAVIVGQHAAAMLLTLSSLAARREVLIARGELGQCAGGCRASDVVTAAGARIREIGAANAAGLADYEQAISTDAAAIVRIHPSNYAIVGDAATASLSELAGLARRRGVTLLDDLGCGGLTSMEKYGLADAPAARQSLQAGADLVVLAGDQLLGGPPCGIVLGKTTLIDKLKSHPLYRSLAVGKLTLAALAATLQLHRDEQRAEFAIPLLSLLAASCENLAHRAAHLAPQIAAADSIASAEAVKGETSLCPGDAPLHRIATWCVALRPAEGDVAALAHRLRRAQPAIFARQEDDRLLIDLRSVFPGQDMQIAEAVTGIKEGEPIAEQDPLPDAE